MTEKRKGIRARNQRASEAFSTKIQEVISNIVITEKNEKQCQNTRIPGTQGTFSKLPQTFDGFTDEPVVQCDVQVVENTFIDDSK